MSSPPDISLPPSVSSSSLSSHPIDVPTSTTQPVFPNFINLSPHQSTFSCLNDDMKRQFGVSKLTLDIMGTSEPPPMLIPRSARALAQWSHRVTPWERSSFTPVGADGITLWHWSRKYAKNTGDRFAPFHQTADFITYSDAEYRQYLEDPNWTKEDTDHLFDLIRQFDARFIIIHDRYAPPSGISRDVDDLKARYVDVTRRVLAQIHYPLADPSTKSSINGLQFDANRERERKAHVQQLLERSEAQVNEEAWLHSMLLDLEVQHILVSRDRAEVLSRFFKGHDPVEMAAYNLRRALAKDEIIASKRKVEAHIPIEGILEYPPEWKLTPGVTLRSLSLRSVKVAAQQKVANFLSLHGIRPLDRPMMSTVRTTAKFDELRATVVQLVDLRRQADKLDAELRTLRHSAGLPPFQYSLAVNTESSTPVEYVDKRLASVAFNGGAQSLDRKKSRRT